MTLEEVTFEEAMKQIRYLVKEKGHGNDREAVEKKLLFAFIELGEATDEWKKFGFARPEKIAEELIDVLFYTLDAYGIMVRDLEIPLPSKMFRQKMAKNLLRATRYGRPE